MKLQVFGLKHGHHWTTGVMGVSYAPSRAGVITVVAMAFATAPHSLRGACLHFCLQSAPSDNNTTRCCSSPSFSHQVIILNLGEGVTFYAILKYKAQIFKGIFIL
jgi:hypothetical protein